MSEFPKVLSDWSALILASIVQTRLVLIVAGLVFVALTVTGALPLLPSLAGFAVIAAAAVIRTARPDEQEEGEVSPPALAPGDPLLQAAIAGIPDAVIALDRGGRVLAFNDPAATMAPALRRGDPASIALRRPELVEAIGLAGAIGESQRIEFSERVPVERWYEAIVAPVGRSLDPKKSLRELVLVTFRDLTPLRRAEEMRADFVANASHELRTPLAALSGFIDTLLGAAREDAAAQQKFLPIMQAQATRMARLIDDLLSLSRIELNAYRQPETRLDLVPLVHQVIDGLQTLARDRGVSVQFKAPEQPQVVLGDRDELIRVFENLIENALKYGASGKRVDVTVAAAELPDGMGELRVCVRDYGPGIAPEHLPRLTERFYRVDVVQSRAQGGTGLGLALVKHILNRHRGHLSIASTPGLGATFTVHIPLPAASGQPEAG